MEKLELFDENSTEKKYNPKITLDKSITPCQIGLTYFFLSLNDDYILTITIVLKNGKKSRTISFCARPD